MTKETSSGRISIGSRLARRRSSVETIDFGFGEANDYPILTGQGFAAKLARKRQRATLTGEQKLMVSGITFTRKTGETTVPTLCLISTRS